MPSSSWRTCPHCGKLGEVVKMEESEKGLQLTVKCTKCHRVFYEPPLTGSRLRDFWTKGSK